jgi:hypothetical protein
MEAVLDFGRGRQKWLKFCSGEYVGGGEKGGGSPDKHGSPCADYRARSSLGLNSCWPHSHLKVEMSLSSPSTLLRVARAVQ